MSLEINTKRLEEEAARFRSPDLQHQPDQSKHMQEVYRVQQQRAKKAEPAKASTAP